MSNMATTQWPAPRATWTMTVLLTLAYVFSYVDRAILGLLIEPITADIHLSDEQMGYLIGRPSPSSTPPSACRWVGWPIENGAPGSFLPAWPCGPLPPPCRAWRAAFGRCLQHA